jgi:hypothetical protein
LLFNLSDLFFDPDNPNESGTATQSGSEYIYEFINLPIGEYFIEAKIKYNDGGPKTSYTNASSSVIS